ncbi:MAG TPA: hypothetical protein VHV78_03555, partial [Gemmatimonadaceae bacterium]|nr:hypothetical protein [Gemmatimonadaceae bacterium]
MHTLRAAADLLIAADSIDRLTPLAALAGCAGEPAPLDERTRHALALDAPAVLDARIAAGAGSLRALLVVAGHSVELRDVLTRLSARLSARTAH